MVKPSRVFLLHAYFYSMKPISEAFADVWPEAETLNLLDESLYADVGEDGSIPASIESRLRQLFRHCELSGADGIVFTGSTFGAVVEATRASVGVPVLKADEAVAEYAVQMARNILIMCTARRALPVIRAGLEAVARKAGVDRTIAGVVVEGAKQAIDRGDIATHNGLILEQAKAAKDFDAIIFGQASMEPALASAAPDLARRIMTSPRASAMKMRTLLTAPSTIGAA